MSHVRGSSKTEQSRHPSAQHHSPLLAGTISSPGLSTCTGLPKDTSRRSSPSAHPCPRMNGARPSLAFSVSYWFPIVMAAVPSISSLSQPLLTTKTGHTESRGARQPLERRACSADICREAGFGHLKPRQKKTAFRGQSPLQVLLCALLGRAITQPATQQQFPITAWALTHQQLPFPRGIHTSSQELVSPRFTRCALRGWCSGSWARTLPCPSGQAEPQHTLPASSSQRAQGAAALKCHSSVFLFSNNSPAGGFAERDGRARQSPTNSHAGYDLRFLRAEGGALQLGLPVEFKNTRTRLRKKRRQSSSG